VSDDEDLLGLLQDELSDGIAFLSAKGHPGAVITVTGPDRVGAVTLELGGRFAARPDRSAHVVVEIDPARVGWRVEAWLSVWLDAEESPDTIDVGDQRLTDPSDPEFAGRVLARRGYVSLWKYLEGPVDGSRPVQG
jgi:hypothetical protein